jgi:hypothetical protein
MATDRITFDDARILFRNFAGRETKYNREGDRNFCVVIPDELVEPLRADGWNVKQLPPREDYEPLHYMKVSLNFKGRTPPKIVIITSRGRTDIDQSLVEMLDFADMARVDLIVNPYNWSVNGGTGVSAYLKTMFFTIREDELELRYADVPEIGFDKAPLAIEAAREELWEAEVVE